MRTVNLTQIKNQLKFFDPKMTTTNRRWWTVLFVAQRIGTDVTKLSRVTRLPEGTVTRALELFANRGWVKNGRVVPGWTNKLLATRGLKFKLRSIAGGTRVRAA